MRRQAPHILAQSGGWVEPSTVDSLTSFLRTCGGFRVCISNRDHPGFQPLEASAFDPPQRTSTRRHGTYHVPESIEELTLRVRTRVPDAERRLGRLLSLLESDELKCYTSCLILPEEREVVRDIGAWLLGVDPAKYTTERILNARGSLWDSVRAHVVQAERAPGVAAQCEPACSAEPEPPS